MRFYVKVFRVEGGKQLFPLFYPESPIQCRFKWLFLKPFFGVIHAVMKCCMDQAARQKAHGKVVKRGAGRDGGGVEDRALWCLSLKRGGMQTGAFLIV